jgi:NMD protein affecting ribosome stability and mRNA decay
MSKSTKVKDVKKSSKKSSYKISRSPKTIAKNSTTKKHSIKNHSNKTIKKIERKTHAIRKPKKSEHKQYGVKFCPNCGNSITGSGHESGLCKKCSGTDFNFKEIKLFTCNSCKSYNYKNKWKEFYDLDAIMKLIITDCIKEEFKYHNLDENTKELLLSYKAGVHKDFIVKISIGREHFDLPAVIDVTLCPKCCKKGTKYFEGILQVRNASNEIYKFIHNDLTRNKYKGVHINKEIVVDSLGRDRDYYYTDKGYLKIISSKLREQFGAIVKQNAQLFSIDWETSKNLYRLNVLVEFPKYNKNDVLKIDNQLYRIISMDEKIHVINLETNTKTLFPHKDSYDVLKSVKLIVIKKYPEFEVLDPNTYYQAKLMNPNSEIDVNDTITAIIDGSQAWMVKD